MRMRAGFIMLFSWIVTIQLTAQSDCIPGDCAKSGVRWASCENGIIEYSGRGKTVTITVKIDAAWEHEVRIIDEEGRRKNTLHGDDKWSETMPGRRRMELWHKKGPSNPNKEWVRTPIKLDDCFTSDDSKKCDDLTICVVGTDGPSSADPYDDIYVRIVWD